MQMTIEDNLTIQDVERAGQGPPASPEMFAHGYHTGLKALEALLDRRVNSVLSMPMDRTERQTLICGLHYRLHCFLKTGLALSDARHFQSIAALTRSVTEIYFDMELLSQEKIPDGVAKFRTHVDVQKLRAARQAVTFYTAHPEIHKNTQEQAQFIVARGTAIDDAVRELWGEDRKGRRRTPEHWSDRKFRERAQLLGVTFERTVVDLYHLQNWLVHGGLTGVHGLPAEFFPTFCRRSYMAVFDALIGATRVLAKELGLATRINDLDSVLQTITVLPGLVVTDMQLRALGEPQRVKVTL